MLKKSALFIAISAILIATPAPLGLRAQQPHPSEPITQTPHQQAPHEQTPHAPGLRQPPPPLTRPEKAAIVDSLCKLLDAYYIYPAVGTKMIEFLVQQSSRGAYDSLTDPQAFAARLRADLVSVSQDQHFNIVFDPVWVNEQQHAITKKDSLDLLSQDSLRGASRNFGFAEVRILPGNLGYFNLTGFDNPLYAGETAAAAMQLLSHTNALIIDLRNNGGGFSAMVQLLASYLFDAEPVHIVDMYRRTQTESYTQDWTLPYVPGRRLPGTDVYILTSHQTFSAAESFSYFLKNRHRATIVGETTGGGAHPVDRKIITDRFYIFLPVARPVDPITGTDWEGVGVKPDVEIPAKDALLTARRIALEKQSAARPDDLNLTWALDAVKAELHPVTLAPAALKSYTGVYGDRRIKLENGLLYFQRVTAAGTAGNAMVPLSETLFMIPELPFIRITFVVEKGQVVGMKRQYDDGRQVNERKEPDNLP